MSVPNVNCFLRYYDNPDTLEKNPAKQEKYGEARKFYSSNKSYDYVTYVQTGTKQKIDYVDYSGDHEKSTGVFGKNGLLSSQERKALRQRLRATKSIIWDCVLTFQPEFGQTYCNDFEQAQSLMRKEFPRFLKDAGLNPSNITWYAGLHTNKRHRHIHISFFEDEPTRIRANKRQLVFSNGKLPKESINRFKLRAELCMTDVAAELRVARKDVTSIAKHVIFSTESNLKYDGQFRERIVRLIERLPEEGRLSYDSENMQHLKSDIKQIVDNAMKTNRKWYKAFTGFCGEVQKRDIEIRTILARNHIPEEHWSNYLNADTYLEDMYRRLGNQILNYARIYKKKEGKAKGRLARKRIKQQTASNLILKSADMQASMEAEAMFFFREYLRKLDEAREENIMESECEMD